MVTIWPDASPMATRTVGNFSSASAAEVTSASASFCANSLTVHDGCTAAADGAAAWRAVRSQNLSAQDASWPGVSRPTVNRVVRWSLCTHTCLRCSKWRASQMHCSEGLAAAREPVPQPAGAA